jgi:uncharacterized protein YndB with AHSA1/START domain
MIETPTFVYVMYIDQSPESVWRVLTNVDLWPSNRSQHVSDRDS